MELFFEDQEDMKEIDKCITALDMGKILLTPVEIEERFRALEGLLFFLWKLKLECKASYFTFHMWDYASRIKKI